MSERRNKVGDALIDYMRREQCFVACSLDGCIGDIAYDLDLPLWRNMNPHPLNRMRVAMSYLRRDDRFEKNLMRGHDSNGRSMLLTSVRLKQEYR